MLENLKARLGEIEKAIVNTNQSLFILQGHKNEVEFQIGEALKEQDEKEKAQEKDLETQVDVPVE